MIDIKKLFHDLPYIITTSKTDTTNLLCHRGHVYADGDRLIASLDAGTPRECRQLRQLGDVVMDGDFGELSVAFPYTSAIWSQVRKILRPKQSACLNLAA